MDADGGPHGGGGMIRLHVKCVTGHYRVPGAVPTMGVAQSYPMVPPATVRGFVECLSDLQWGNFKGRIAIGRVGAPVTRGKILRSDHVSTQNRKVRKVIDQRRPVHWDIHVDPAYQIAVDSPENEDDIHRALRGESTRYGVLSLGTSEDEVYYLREEEVATEWLVPGKTMVLPIRTYRGCSNPNPEVRFWDFSPQSQRIPDEAWTEFERFSA